jgi:hypothetical protein
MPQAMYRTLANPFLPGTGYEHVQAWEMLQVDDRDKPLSPVTIVNCGELVLAKKAEKPKVEECKYR